MDRLLEPTIVGKWLELLKEIAPRVARVAFLFNPATASFAEYYLTPFKAAARSFAVETMAAPVRDLTALETVIADLAGKSNGGLVIMPDSFLITHRATITSLAARHRVPAVYPYRHFTEVGGRGPPSVGCTLARMKKEEICCCARRPLPFPSQIPLAPLTVLLGAAAPSGCPTNPSRSRRIWSRARGAAASRFRAEYRWWSDYCGGHRCDD
jgi:hypothetical protein